MFAGVGIALLLHQAIFAHEPNQWIIFAALICMGLPIPMFRDEEREAKRKGEEPPP